MSTTGEIENALHTALYCPQCREKNLPQWKYCAQCGASLWEACLRCGEMCAAGESYCGACGACLNELVAEQVERLESDLRTAAELEAAFRFDEAIALLANVAKNDHPRLAEHAGQAKQRIARLTEQRRQLWTVAEEARQRANGCVADADYDGAARFIESVPVTLQDEDLRQLGDQIARRRREIDDLTREMQDAVRERRLLELPSCIERLLALKPDHAYARSVAEQVQKRLVAAAKKMLAVHRYDQSLHLLDQISGWADAADFEPVRRQAMELAWLDRDLRNAPFIDNTLVAVAERLCRLVPNDAHAARLRNELHRRIRLAKDKRHERPLAWRNPPKQTPLGVPVEWLTGFQRVACAETLDRSDLSRHPGRFAVACGLALAGVKRASLRINLLSGQRQGVLHRAKHLIRSQTVRSAWGIDIGVSSLKAVKLVCGDAKQQAVVEAAVLIEHAKPLSHAANGEEEDRLVSETLKTLCERHSIKNDVVCVGLSGRMTLSRQIVLPPVGLAKAAKLIQFEASRQFPIPLDQLAWDYQILGPASNPNAASKTPDETRRQALLIAARRARTQPLVDAFRRLHAPIDLLQPDFVALHNFLVYDRLTAQGDSPSGDANRVVAAVDIGCDVTNLVVSSPHSLWHRSCGVAGQNFTRALVTQFNLTLAKAEQRKRTPESAERLSDLYKALSPVCDDLLAEVQQSLAAYAESQPNCSVERVFGLGGGFSLHGLLRCFLDPSHFL